MTGYVVGQVIALPPEPPVGTVVRGRRYVYVRRLDNLVGWCAGSPQDDVTSIPAWEWHAVLADGPVTVLEVPGPAPDVVLARAVTSRGHYETCGASLTEQPGDCNCPVSLAAAYLAGRQP